MQLREKDLDGRALAELARALRAVTAAAGVALYVNDRVDVALAVGADGVHLGGSVAGRRRRRARSRPGSRIAVSAHAPAEVAALRAAAGDRIAFALLGPIRDTPSKRALRRAARRPRAVTEAARSGIPVVAVGGIDPQDVARAARGGRARRRLHPRRHGRGRPGGSRQMHSVKS